MTEYAVVIVSGNMHRPETERARVIRITPNHGHGFRRIVEYVDGGAPMTRWQAHLLAAVMKIKDARRAGWAEIGEPTP